MSDVIDIRGYSVWLLFPSLQSDDPNLQYYYDFEPALAEYTRAFAELGCEWHSTYVRVDNIESVLDDIESRIDPDSSVIINLCDGDELNGVPGISVVRSLERRGLCYTGAREAFYYLTTSKVDMKKCFDAAGVATAPWLDLSQGIVPDDIFDRCGLPLIVKPAVSGGSMGLSVRNVVHNRQELDACLLEMKEGYHGWKLEDGGILAERFIAGPEFTTFIVGSGDNITYYPAAERKFHDSLPEHQKFLSFDRLWETYDTETPMPDDEFVYTYAEVTSEMAERLRDLSLAAYHSVQGTGYGRLDIRQDSQSGELFVLEVNAQCGLSEDDNYTSIGAILRFAKENFADLTRKILVDAVLLHSKQRSMA